MKKAISTIFEKIKKIDMKKFLFSLAIFAGFTAINAQTVLFEDNFDSYEDFIIDGVGDWIMIDMDGSPTYSYSGENTDYAFSHAEKAFQVFNPSTALNVPANSDTFNIDPHSGSKFMGAWASVTPANDDWMISPPITLGASDNNVEFYVAALSPTYGPEAYNIHVYAGSDVPSVGDFDWIDGTEVDFSEGWRKDSYNLDAYANQTVRIAIQCVSNDVYLFKLDDFKVTTGSLGVSDLNANVSSVYPNPVVDSFNVNLSSKFNANNLTVTVTDLSGKTVKTFGSASSYNVSDLPKGVYVVKITDGKNTDTKKIVKK